MPPSTASTAKIVPNGQIVRTEVYEMPAAPEGAGALNTITFTEVEAHDAHDPRADREHGGLRRDHHSGMEAGLQDAMDLLEQVAFASLSTRRSFGRLTEHLQALA